MARFKMPKNATEILRLVEDANRLHEEKVKLEALVNGMMADGGKGKPGKKASVSSAPSSSSNPWASAMSVAAVKEASDKNMLPRAPPITDSDDSGVI